MTRKNIKLFFISAFLGTVLLTLVLPTVTFGNTDTALGVGANTGGIITNPIKYDNVQSLLIQVLTIFLRFAVVIATFFVIYSGFLFVTAGGKSEQVKKATEIFKNTIIGAAIILGSFVILQVIESTIKTFTR